MPGALLLRNSGAEYGARHCTHCRTATREYHLRVIKRLACLPGVIDPKQRIVGHCGERWILAGRAIPEAQYGRGMAKPCLEVPKRREPAKTPVDQGTTFRGRVIPASARAGAARSDLSCLRGFRSRAIRAARRSAAAMFDMAAGLPSAASSTRMTCSLSLKTGASASSTLALGRPGLRRRSPGAPGCQARQVTPSSGRDRERHRSNVETAEVEVTRNTVSEGQGYPLHAGQMIIQPRRCLWNCAGSQQIDAAVPLGQRVDQWPHGVKGSRMICQKEQATFGLPFGRPTRASGPAVPLTMLDPEVPPIRCFRRSRSGFRRGRPATPCIEQPARP